MTHLYGCHNRQPFTKSYTRHDIDTNTGEPMSVTIPFVMEPDCQFTKSELGEKDPGCAGCKHKKEKSK